MVISVLFQSNNLLSASSETEENRGYPFAFKIDLPNESPGDKNPIQIYDVPTCLDTISKCIGLHLHKDVVGNNSEIARLEKRELFNFCKTLHNLLSENKFALDHVVIHENVV